MTNKLVIILAVITGFLLMSCEQNVVGPSKSTATVVFKMNKSGKANHGNLFFMKNNHLPKVNPQQVLKTNTYDEVKLAMLDMTKFKTPEEFEDYWSKDSAGQALINNMTFDSTSDIFDIVVSVLRGYAGAAYGWIGDYTFPISDSVAKGSVYVNPGLNYYFYAFRQNGKTDYLGFGGDFCMIVPDSINTITLNAQGGNGNNEPEVPTLTSPTNNATGVSLSTYLDWYSLNAETYTLQVSIDSQFKNNIFNQSGLTSNYQLFDGLTANTTYYWRVNASNNIGTSAWSETWQFTTGASK